MKSIVCSLVLVLSLVAGPGAFADGKSLAAARGVMDDFMTTFNARDPKGWAATFNYPHVRFASGSVAVSPDAAAIAQGMDFEAFAAATGWDHSAWNSVEVLDAGATKVHFKVQFSRYKADGSILATYGSLYVVTLKDGHWGIQARSSFAP